MPTEDLIRDLIATGTMNPETLADLERWRTEASEGRLDPDDAAYIAALHARVTGSEAPAETAPIVQDEARADGLTAAEWRDRALAAEAELAALRDQMASSSTI